MAVSITLYAATAVVCIFLFTVLLYRSYARTGTPYFTAVVVITSWFLAFSTMILVPLDLLPTTLIGKSTLRRCWNLLYWAAFLITWILCPLLSSYYKSGEFKTAGRVRAAVVANVKYYAITVVVAGAALAWVMVRHHVTASSLIGLVIGLANAWGLLLAVALLGVGLVDVPRRLWHRGDHARRLDVCRYTATLLRDELTDATEECHDLGATIDDVGRRVPTHDERGGGTEAAASLRACYEQLAAAQRAGVDALNALQHGDSGASSSSSRSSTSSSKTSTSAVDRDGVRRATGGDDAMLGSVVLTDGDGGDRAIGAVSDFHDSALAMTLRDPSTVVTERHLAQLHRLVKQSLRTLEFVDARWRDNATTAFALEELVAVSKSGGGAATGRRGRVTGGGAAAAASFSPIGGGGGSGNGSGRGCAAALRRRWRAHGQGHASRALACVCGALSLLFIWSELTLPVTSVNVSPLAGVYAGVRGDFTGTHVVVLPSLLYLSFCAAHSLFNIRLSRHYHMDTQQRTGESSLLFNAQYVLRLPAPLAYNFVTLLHVDNGDGGNVDRDRNSGGGSGDDGGSGAGGVGRFHNATSSGGGGGQSGVGVSGGVGVDGAHHNATGTGVQHNATQLVTNVVGVLVGGIGGDDDQVGMSLVGSDASGGGDGGDDGDGSVHVSGDGDGGGTAPEEMAFTQMMGRMDAVPLLSTTMTRYLAVAIGVCCLCTYLHVYAKVAKLLGMPHFASTYDGTRAAAGRQRRRRGGSGDDDIAADAADDDNGVAMAIEEGKQLLRRERRRRGLESEHVMV